MQSRIASRSRLAVAVLTAAVALSLAGPARAALIAYWPLTDGADGTAVTGADETIDTPGSTFTEATVNGAGQTWVFDATRDRIVLSTIEGRRLNGGTQAIDRNVGFTWSVWANVSSSNLTDTGADTIIGTRQEVSGVWNKVDLASSGNWAGISYPTLADNAWHHIAYVGDSTSVRLYVDGVLKGTDTTTPTATYNGLFEFGGSQRYSEDMTGLLSDVAVFDEALTPAQIQGLADGTLTPSTVPEPSAALGLAGCAAAVCLRRRDRKNRSE